MRSLRIVFVLVAAYSNQIFADAPSTVAPRVSLCGPARRIEKTNSADRPFQLSMDVKGKQVFIQQVPKDYESIFAEILSSEQPRRVCAYGNSIPEDKMPWDVFSLYLFSGTGESPIQLKPGKYISENPTAPEFSHIGFLTEEKLTVKVSSDNGYVVSNLFDKFPESFSPLYSSKSSSKLYSSKSTSNLYIYEDYRVVEVFHGEIKVRCQQPVYVALTVKSQDTFILEIYKNEVAVTKAPGGNFVCWPGDGVWKKLPYPYKRESDENEMDPAN